MTPTTKTTRLELLGRGSMIEVRDGIVYKTAPPVEALLMKRFPEVFVPVLSITSTGYTMPEWERPRINEDRRKALLHGLELLRNQLWVHEGLPTPLWREKLYARLSGQIERHGLLIRRSRLDSWFQELPNPRECVMIHGDPTLANIVKSNDDWRWLDPLQRDYIPGHTVVDVGKMLQSCWDYESVLLGASDLTFDHALADELCDVAGVHRTEVLAWLFIHVVRFLPYQDARVRGIYERALDVGF